MITINNTNKEPEFAPWIDEWEVEQENVQYWKEHSKRSLTLQDLNNFFGEEV